MNRISSITFLSVLAASGLAAAAPAYTTPVGYVSLGNTSGGNAVPANTDVNIGIPFSKPKEFSGVLASASTTTIQAGANISWAVNQWAGNAANPYYVVITSGTENGASALINSNTATALTITPLSGNFANVTSTTTFSIIPCWTLGKFISAASVPAGTQILAFTGTAAGYNLAPNLAYVSSGANWIQTVGGPPVAADNAILYPSEGLIVRTGPNPIASLVTSGEIPTFNQRVVLSKLSPAGTAQDIRISYFGSVGDTVLNSGLGRNPGDQLLIIDNSTAGTNKAPTQSLVYTGSAWIGAVGLSGNQNNFVLESGKAYIYRVAATAAPADYDWNDVQSYRSNL